MAERIWDKFLTEGDKALFAAGGFGARAGFGKRPALLVIDVNWAFCGERPEPILESIKRWRTSCGEESWVALKHIKSRWRGIPALASWPKERSAKSWVSQKSSRTKACPRESGGAVLPGEARSRVRAQNGRNPLCLSASGDAAWASG